MNQTYIVIFFSLLLAVGCQRKTSTPPKPKQSKSQSHKKMLEASAEQKARQVLTSVTVDPSSVVFHSLFVTELMRIHGEADGYLCKVRGEIDAKNGMGGQRRVSFTIYLRRGREKGWQTFGYWKWSPRGGDIRYFTGEIENPNQSILQKPTTVEEIGSRGVMFLSKPEVT